MKNSIKKRIRFTKNGKLVRRPMGVDHFKTRRSTKSNRNGRKNSSIHSTLRKSIITSHA
jgi:ribosomal protein L35